MNEIDIRADFNLNVEESEIVRLLGYKGSEPTEDVLEYIREEIQNSKSYVKPKIWSEKIYVKSIEKDRVVLENLIVFEGEFIANKLRGCTYIIVLVSTIGSDIDNVIQTAFNEGEYLKAMIVDNIGTTTLGYINKIFWNSLLDNLNGTNIGITQRLSPGDVAWHVNEQNKIFSCFYKAELEVKLLESHLMVPLKSTTAVFGFGQDIGITRIEHICSECNMQTCSYRIDTNVKVRVKTNNDIFSLNAFIGQNLMEVLMKNNILMENPCNGKGTCGKCKVLITDGVGQPSKTDALHLSNQDIEKGYRLACSYKVSNDIEVIITSKEESISILTAGKERYVDIHPYIRKKFVELNAPSINDQRDDLHRLRDALQLNKISISNKILCKLSDTIRKEDFKVTACIYENTVLALESGDTRGALYGIAIDIGTTTIACYLVDMVNGKTLDIASEVNKQRGYGADVISRINFTVENSKGVEILKNLIVSQINEMVELLCLSNKLTKDQIYNMSIAGNTVMIHMLLGISCISISVAPYIPVFTENMDFPGEELGINIGGIVSILPGISSYVGSDITAGILASGMIDTEKNSILLDLGTNGEIAIGNKDGIVVCSTAAGPAFEGANIKCGIGGVKGAISKIQLTSSDEKIYKTIGDDLPLGICGSGVVDAVSELLKSGVIDETGRMLNADEIENEALSNRIVVIDGIKQFIVEEGGKNNNPIYFTQKDVREVQLAKAAISAGIKILIAEKGIRYEEIEKIYVAGGFGNFMDIHSTINIGMLPKELEHKLCSIGNSAGDGARMWLLSQEQKKKAMQIKTHTNYVELSNRVDFQEYFIDSMMF